MGLLNIGSNALTAAYRQINVVSHNIANVNTPGYSRQEAVQTALEGSMSGAGFFGRGTEITTVRRRYDQFVERELALSTSSSAADAARSSQLARLDQLFSNRETGVGAGIDQFRSGLADLVNRPADASARLVAYRSADGLARSIRDTDNQLRELGAQTDQRIAGHASRLNDFMNRLAKLNNEIALQSGSGQPPNDLMDQRDFIVSEINKSIRATAYINPDNTASLFAASGQALVVGGSVASFSTQADPVDPTRQQLVLTTLGSTVDVDGTTLGGGELAGLIAFRDEDLASARARLGQISVALASEFNALQKAGIDGTGSVGAANQDMFSFTSPLVTAATNNTGNASLNVSIADGSQVLASDYSISRQAGSWLVTRTSDGTTTSYASLPQTIDGLTLSAGTGSANVGDRFLLRSGSVMASGFSLSLSSPARLASGLALTPQLGGANAGDVKVQAFDHDASAPNGSAAVNLTFTSATTFDISGPGIGSLTNQTYTPGQAIQFNGWSLTLQGSPRAGDSLSLATTASPSTDNRNARAMLEALDKGISGGRSATDRYSELIADVGSRAGIARVSAQMSEQSLQDTQSVRDAISGVNLDEEAARLMQFQQAYQAAAKIIQTAQSMFDTLLQAAG
jgi:flagellar hook-associated protein 1